MKSCVHLVLFASFISFATEFVTAGPSLEDLQVSSQLNMTFACNAHTMNVCGPQDKPQTSPRCRAEGYKITAFGFRQLAAQLEQKSKRVAEEVETTPHFLPKYSNANYNKKDINETLYERVPSPLTPGQKDSVTVICNGTWNSGTPAIGLQRLPDCDSGPLSCSQIHAIVDNVAMLELSRHLKENAKENDKKAEEFLQKERSNKLSRTFVEEDKANVGNIQNFKIITKTLGKAPKLKLKLAETLSTTTAVTG